MIPARGGSKRLPGKNLRLLGGRPLVAWSIATGLQLDAVADVLVSTDDETIAEVARALGALVPWLRPSELSTDEATTTDVALHALDWYEQARGPVDGLLLLQPTTPFRRLASMHRGMDLFAVHDRRAVVGVCQAGAHPLWCFTVAEGRLRPFVHGGGLDLRSQDLPEALVVNGAFYLVQPDQLRRTGSFFGEAPTPLRMDGPEESIDIDTPLDLMVAQTVLTALELT